MKTAVICLGFLSFTISAFGMTSFTTNFDTGYESYFEIRGGGAIVEAGKLATPTKDYTVLAATHDTDLLADDWVATVTYTTLGNRDYVNIYAGLGDPTAGWAWGGTLFCVQNAKVYTNIDMTVFTNSPSNVYTPLETFTGYTAYGGTITITKTGDEITFETARTGVTYTSGPWSISTVAPWLDATNCRFFVGTSSLNAWITSVDMGVVEHLPQGGSFETSFDTGYETLFEIRGGDTAVINENGFSTSLKDFNCVAVSKGVQYLTVPNWVATVEYSTAGNLEYLFISAGLGDPQAAYDVHPQPPAFYTRAGKWYANQDMAVVTSDPNLSVNVFEAFTGYTSYGGRITIIKSDDDITFNMERGSGQTFALYSSGPWSISTVAPWLDDVNGCFFVSSSTPNAYVSNVKMYVGAPASLTGTISLEGYTSTPNDPNSSGGNLSSVLIGVQLRKQDGDTTSYSRFLAEDGTFAIDGIEPGTYDIWIKAATSLAKLSADVVLDAGVSMDMGPIALTNGDCDNDNEISSTDMSVVLLAMNTELGDSQWNESADLHGDGIVNNTDLSIALLYMGQRGDL